MGDVLLMADEVQGYAMTDRATYLSMQDKLELEILVEGDSRLFNQYGVLKLNDKLHTHINSDGADELSLGYLKMILRCLSKNLE